MRKLTSVTKKRFDYVRMTGADLATGLDHVDMNPAAFCRIFGVNGHTVKKWLEDEQDIPPWVFVALALLKTGPHMPAVARAASADHIKFDHNFPDRGEFPYRTSRKEDS